MLENLRAMAVFASVVHHGSFSGAGKELGITTSAVSQQIRALELDLGVTLLHRSTRKLSLTEAGASLYESAKSMVRAAEEARDNVSQFRDELLGSLRIATTPKIASEHILPALSVWLHKHTDLSLKLFTGNDTVDMIDERVDLSINFSLPNQEMGVPLAKVKQLLLASPEYLTGAGVPSFETLASYSYIAVGEDSGFLDFGGSKSVKLNPRFATNDAALALSMAKEGYGIVKANALDAKTALTKGELVQILPEYDLPILVLYAKTLSKDQQPAKVWRCLEVLTEYFLDKSS